MKIADDNIMGKKIVIKN